MDLQLHDHTVFITGAASGIGRAAARAFAAEQCKLALFDRATEVVDTAAEIAREFTLPTFGYRGDISDFSAVSAAFAAAEVDLGPIGHVVHCAAIGSGKFGFPFTNLTPSEWRNTLEVNIMGMVNVAHAAVESMRTRRYGSFVFLASVAGQIGSQTDPPYSASKAANINFAQCMAKDLAPFGIRVNTVCPGMVKSPLNRSVWQAWFEMTAEDERLSYEEWADRKIKSVIPLGTWQSPDDVAAMIVFLSSSRASQVTGQTINVDGGFVMHW